MPLNSARFLSCVDIALRIPPLFVIDEILKSSLHFIGFDNQHELDISVPEDKGNVTIQLSKIQIRALVYEIVIVALFKFLFCAVAVLIALCIFVLWRRHLLVVYTYLISLGTIYLSYWLNLRTVKDLTQANWSIWSPKEPHQWLSLDSFVNYYNTSEHLRNFTQNAMLQLILAAIFANIHMSPRRRSIQMMVYASFLLPSLMHLLSPCIPDQLLSHSAEFATLLPLAISKFVIWYHFFTLMEVVLTGYSFIHTYVIVHGPTALIEKEWHRLKIPRVLRTFWFIRVLENTLVFVLLRNFPTVFDYGVVLDISRNALITGCETLLAVLGMTSVVSILCQYIGSAFIWFLMAQNSDKTIGHVSAILFYVLALQTGLTGLEPDARFVRLCRNFCLLITALLHFIHNIVSPIMMSLSALQVQSLNRHIRALSVCAFLIIFPMCLLYHLWSNYYLTTWLLAVTAFSIEVIVKVGVTLASYSLFMIDALSPNVWDKCDDYNYYIKAFGNSVEFLFGIFLFFNGAWILIFESGGAIRAIMMCIHAYFNIWSEARAGWAGFMRRRTAVSKINSLTEATLEQLQRLNDVCAICYSNMTTAKITKCNHYFHSSCLRRWLYVQDRCPLCHDILYKVDVNDAVKLTSN